MSTTVRFVAQLLLYVALFKTGAPEPVIKKELDILDTSEAVIYECAFNTIDALGSTIRSITVMAGLPNAPATKSVTLFITEPTIVSSNPTISNAPDTPMSLRSMRTSVVATTTAPNRALEKIQAYTDYTGRQPCPTALASQFNRTYLGPFWTMFCNTDLYFGDLQAFNTSSFTGCLDSCDLWNLGAFGGNTSDIPCVAVTYASQAFGFSSNCFLKQSVSKAVYNAKGFDSAKLLGYNIPNNLQVSVYSPLPFATSIATAATAIPSGPYQPAGPCPTDGSVVYIRGSGRNVYQVQCNVTYPVNDLPGLYTNSLQNCIAACDAWVPVVDPSYQIGVQQPCIGVVYQQYIKPKPGGMSTVNCQLKYALEQAITGTQPLRVAAVRYYQPVQMV